MIASININVSLSSHLNRAFSVLDITYYFLTVSYETNVMKVDLWKSKTEFVLQEAHATFITCNQKSSAHPWWLQLSSWQTILYICTYFFIIINFLLKIFLKWPWKNYIKQGFLHEFWHHCSFKLTDHPPPLHLFLYNNKFFT